MRITVTILGVIFSLFFGLQALAVGTLSDAVNDEATATAGAVGLVAALMWFIAGAMAWPLPLVSTILFGLSSLMVFSVGAASYGDLVVWGVIGIILTILSFFAWRGKKKADAREYERDRLLMQALSTKS